MVTSLTYDLFISYAAADQAWVKGFLLDALEQAGVRYHYESHFTPGTPRLLELGQAIEQSLYTVLVISTAYLADGFNEFSNLLAQSYGQETGSWPVIPLILDPEVEMPLRLRMLTPLDATQPTRWTEAVKRLCDLFQHPAPQPTHQLICPYPGMVPFYEADQDRFYGRDVEVESLIAHLRLYPFLTVIGPSGSGKSSLVFAGLVPALKRSGLFGCGEWIVRSIRPGETPMQALNAILKDDPTELVQAIAEQPRATRMLLIVDQFEEIFTVARQGVEAFQTALLHLAQRHHCYVVLTVRADFYADLMASPLWHIIQAHRVEVVPLDESGLRQAIERPAAAMRVFVEPTLVERLIADAAGEPGILPLVQETLVLLWERLERRFLPLSAYHAVERSASGNSNAPGRTGLQIAIARRADDALKLLATDQQSIARRIFLRLVQFGEGRADTRRQQTVSALRAISDDLAQFDTTLHHLITRRLLTASGDERNPNRKVDIAHEALISSWPTLQDWVIERRNAEQTRRRLEAKVSEWIRLGPRNGGLLDDVELLEAEHWLQSPDAFDLGYDATLLELVHISRTDQLERLREQHLVTRFRRLALSVITLLIMAALGTALWSAQRGLDFERQRSQEQAEAAATAETLQNEAEQQARIAAARQLASQADGELERHPQRSLLLSIEALNRTSQANESRVPAAEETMRKVLTSTGGRVLSSHNGPINTIVMRGNNRWAVTGDRDGVAWVWDLEAADPAANPIVLPGHVGQIYAVAISEDNRWLVTAGADGVARVWDLEATDPAAKPIVLRGHEGWIGTVTISRNNRWVVTAGKESVARVWDLEAADPTAKPIMLPGHEAEIDAVTISKDNRWVVTAGNNGMAWMWDLEAADPAAKPITPWGREYWIDAIEVSENNRWIVTGSANGTVQVWDLETADPAAKPIMLSGHIGQISALTMSRDSRWVVTGSEDSTVRVWDLQATNPESQPIVLRGHDESINAVTMSEDNRWVVTGGDDRVARVWDLEAVDPAAKPIILRGHDGAITAVALSKDNRWVVTDGADGTARIWDLQAKNPAEPITLRGHKHYIYDVVLSEDNRWVVTGSEDGTARVWDLQAKNPAAKPIVLGQHEGGVNAVAVSEDNHWVVTGGDDRMARVWDLEVADPAAKPILLLGHTSWISAVAISRDNHWVVTGDGDGIARLWDLEAADPAAKPIGLRGHEGWIRTVTISRDNRWVLTSGSDGIARLWDLEAANPSAQPIVLRSGGGIFAVAISRDSRWVVTGSEDGTVRVWNLEAANPSAQPIVLRSDRGIRAVMMSRDSRWVVTLGGSNIVRVWDLQAANMEAQSFFAHGHDGPIVAARMSEDSRWLVTAGQDGTARVWELQATDPGAQPLVLWGSPGPLIDVEISEDNRWLVLASGYDTAQVWYLRLDDLIALACSTAGRNLTRAEWAQYMPKGEPYRATCSDFPLDAMKPDETRTAIP